MRQVQSDLSRAIGGLRFAPAIPEYPVMNVWANAEGAVLTAEVPGVEPDALDIAVHQDTVTLRGTREPEPLAEGDVVHRAERTTGAFARSFTLPFRLDPESVKASFRQGVLTLELPRPEAERPRRIKVQRA
ncbi:Hsp20/alpha crystallin family protein [Devosia sp.]|uniref:Hsp20/alpha crystallin family protein n=1 Tax=Devosia sp. TaxID=1871048 RepID=UPI002607F9C9|nr:Hsp20/alpha crystallin family protein [Devosia sp.]